MTGKRRAGRDPIRKPTEPLTPPATFASPEPPMMIERTPTRRETRMARRKQQRRRIGLTGGVAIAVVVVIVVGAVIFGAHKLASHKSTPRRTQTTLLLQLQAPDHTAQASALLADDPANNNQGVEVLVPARVITQVCGYNSLNFGDILALPNGDVASRQALSSMLGNITIDGSWILQPSQLTKLVDIVGGITVGSVDTDVVRHTGGGGGQVLVQAGSNVHLNGDQAVEYATYQTSPHEDAEGELARLNEVIDGTVQALPKTPTAIAALLRQLGNGGSSTLGAPRLASFLAGLAAAERMTGHVLPTNLPTTPIDAGGARPSYQLDSAATNSLVSGSLSASVPADASVRRPTVELLNGVGSPGLIATACPLLEAHNLAYAGSDNASSFNNPTSTIDVSNANVALGYQVARALRLPSGDVRRTSEDQSVADVIVTLGNDYRPPKP
jgi:hypothetical protein